jgi:cytochrome c-type biogenesis protein CcmH/NrfF
LLAALLLLAALPAAALAEETPGADLRAIAGKLQCPVCDGTSVADSRSPVAADMRRTIEEKLAAGESEGAILDYFVARYGPEVLREPPSAGLYAAVWWVPGLALAAGAAVVWAMARSKTRTAVNDTEQPGTQDAEPPQQDLDAYRRRIRQTEQERG